MFTYADIMSLDEAIGVYTHSLTIKTKKDDIYFLNVSSKLELKLELALAMEVGYMRCLVSVSRHLEKKIYIQDIPDTEILRLIDEICT